MKKEKKKLSEKEIDALRQKRQKMIDDKELIKK